MKVEIAFMLILQMVLAELPAPVWKGSGDSAYIEVTLDRRNAEGRVD